MNLNDRVRVLDTLGKKLKSITEKEFLELVDRTKNQNPWFTEESIQMSLTGISKFLQKDVLVQWASSYQLPDHFTDKIIALIAAGNIPLVGFHDLLCVLLSGHRALIKVSSKDAVLLPYMISLLKEIEPALEDRIQREERLKKFDAVIATGSDNSSRYFEFYFGKYPHIIRKNRTSCAILKGSETTEELTLLGNDVFTYFGLGCRNVSKLYVPEGYSFTPLLDAWQSYNEIFHHHKYCNNYDYQKAIMLVNSVKFLDGQFVLLTNSNNIVSPIAVVYYEAYASHEDLETKIHSLQDKIQCIVGKEKPATVSFGQAQSPDVWDYADGVDTLEFLSRL